MDVRTEAEQIRQRNYEATAHAYKNIYAALDDERYHDGINAVLKFMHEKQRVDPELPLSEQLQYIEERLQIKMRYAELEAGWWETAVVPMLVKTLDGHWKVVIPNTDGTCFWIEDGKKHRVTAKAAQQFTNSAMCFYKGMKSGKVTAGELLLFMARSSSSMDKVSVATISVLTILIGMLLPWINSFIFAYVIPTGEQSEVWAMTALILSAAAIGAVLKLMQSLILTNFMLRTSVYLQSGIFSRLLTLPTGFFKEIRSGELSRMIMEFSDISKIVSARSIGACISMLLSFAYLIQVRLYAPDLFGWVILISAVYIGLLIWEGVQNTRWQRGYSKSLSRMSGFCYELFSGMEQVKLNGAEARIMRRWSRHYLDASRDEEKPFLLKYSDAVCKLLGILASACIYLFGANMQASDYIAFSAAYGAYIAALLGAGEIIRSVSMFRASYSQVKPMLDTECEESAGKQAPESFAGEITISNLRFRYDRDAPYVIDDLSLHIGPGESLGVIGTSGCGKSTLLRLLLGFEQAEEGSIYIDGYDLRELDLQHYRRQVGTVLQNAGLFTGDIYSNITITKPDAAMGEVRSAVELAGLSDDIAALPMGLHTPISQENCTLSGGQQQRILIARALLHKPSILIFDEATSALDNITQARITAGLNRLHCTKIIVAHRLSTIEDCDRILIMDKGRIAEDGTFEQLMNRDSILKNLMNKQMIRQ